jgi:hypothetical protein
MSGGVLPETDCDRVKSDPVARDRYQESHRAHHKGGLPGSLDTTCATGPWDPARPSPAPRCGRRHGSRRRRPGAAAFDRPVDMIVSTPTRARTAPSEMPPAGRRCALRPLLQFFERSFQKCNRRTGAAAGEAAERRWKAWGKLSTARSSGRIHELPAAFTANSGGQGYAAPYTHTFQSDGSRNHPPIRQLSCRPVCCPVHRAKLKHACLKPMQAASAPIRAMLVGVFVRGRCSARINGGGTISSYACCPYAFPKASASS